MEYKIFLNSYIMSYEKISNMLHVILSNNRGLIDKKTIGVTTFNYKIDCYKIGNGKNHVLLYGTTHGCELVSTYFILELIISLVNLGKDSDLLNNYTFHLIPILNLEGYIISSSNVLKNLPVNSIEYLEKLSKKYLEIYNRDDEIALTGKKCPKLLYNVLKSSVCNINNINMKRSVINILRECNLTESVLPVWSANGVGVDPNSNSIHCFREIVALRKKQKFAYLRYNDIPVTKPSPMSYPGVGTFCNCPENYSLYNYIKGLYTMNSNTLCEDRLIAIFSYHSTGGEIYGFPAEKCMDKEKKEFYEIGMEKYRKKTDYQIMFPETKYGVMDYYRDTLNDVLCLTIELSKLNANPIGPFADIKKLNQEIIDNKKAIVNTINWLSNK